MRRSTKPIIIASRRSELARRQAEMVGRALGKLHPTIDIRYRWIESRGDQVPGPLSGHGGKGLFTRTIESALLDRTADLAVHSLKDLPAAAAEQTPGLALAAIPRRADPRDCLIACNGATTIADLPEAAVVGTASPRRAAQLLRLRPDLRVQLIRGNVDTRVRAITDPDGDAIYHATLLAAAGLRRLGMKHRAAEPLDLDLMLPAAAQGALALQCRADDHVTLTRCLSLNHADTATAVHAERQLVAALGAGCHSPIAVLAGPVPPAQTPARRNADAHWFRLRARVLSPDGTEIIEAADQVRTADLRHLVKRMADDLTARGAGRLLSLATDALTEPACQSPRPSAAAAG